LIRDDQLAEMILIAKAAGSVEQEQMDLFGIHTLRASLAPQQAVIMAYVRERLRHEKRLFRTVLDNRRQLEEARTKVDTITAEDISSGATLWMALLDRMAYSRGTHTNQILRPYAEELAALQTGSKSELLSRAYTEMLAALAADYDEQFPNGSLLSARLEVA
jgi:hypothetical protein